MSIQVRLAGKSDTELIADLSRQTFYDSFAAQNTKDDMDQFMNKIFTREALIDEVGKEGNIFFLAFDNAEVAGYARMREGEDMVEFSSKPSIEIARIYATAASIGKGIGSALMEKCTHTAIEMEKKILWLGVWEYNKRAIDFYTRWGFEKFGEHDFVLGNDVQKDWLMWKWL
jgi:ribosomal protein S18 acetylase RimI-like enzyme